MSGDYINILLIGESGVGKSTFINSFANYIKHDSLDGANKSSLLCLIPTAFTLTDENYVDRTVHFGFDANQNENIEVGKSSTQECKDYTFDVPDIPYKLRLIDTPGVGDSRGVEQDEENIRKIVKHIQSYTHINAICFLLKPNVTILGEYFKYCIDHLLTTLKGAASNLIFVFTHSRSTFYRPGETMTVLQGLINRYSVEIPLSKSNMFCLDNEAFRYGVALQHGFKYSEAELDNFEKSWRISAKSSRDILRYIFEKLQPIELKRIAVVTNYDSMVNLDEYIKKNDASRIYEYLHSNYVNEEVKNEMKDLKVKEICSKVATYFGRSRPYNIGTRKRPASAYDDEASKSKNSLPDYKSLNNQPSQNHFGTRNSEPLASNFVQHNQMTPLALSSRTSLHNHSLEIQTSQRAHSTLINARTSNASTSVNVSSPSSHRRVTSSSAINGTPSYLEPQSNSHRSGLGAFYPPASLTDSSSSRSSDFDRPRNGTLHQAPSNRVSYLQDRQPSRDHQSESSIPTPSSSNRKNSLEGGGKKSLCCIIL